MCLHGAIEITDYTPLVMVILSIEEEVEEVRGRGREWIQERQMERPSRNSNRGNGQSNGTRPRDTTSTSVPQMSQQDDEWSMPPTTERREDIERQQITQASLPVAPPPTEERLFTNWSSEGSPPERITQQVQSARSMEPNEITFTKRTN